MSDWDDASIDWYAENFGEDIDEAVIQRQNYDSTLESHGFTNIETRPLGPHSEGFVTVAVKKAGPDVH